MRIPSKEECYTLMCEMGMLPNIVAHSLQVCRVATFLVDHMSDRVLLDRGLVQSSALLHDITKTRSLKTGEVHALTGADLIHDMGYPDVAYIIGQHVILDEISAVDIPAEVEIVNYADKRVLHDRVVSLEERKDYILQRYVKNPGDMERISRNWLKAKALEKKLFGFLPFAPEDLDHLLLSHNLSVEMQKYHNVCTRIFNGESRRAISFDGFASGGVDSQT